MNENTEVVWWSEDLMRRYQKSRPTIWRWRTAGHLPKPDVFICDKQGWYPATILEFEKQSANGAAA